MCKCAIFGVRSKLDLQLSLIKLKSSSDTNFDWLAYVTRSSHIRMWDEVSHNVLPHGFDRVLYGEIPTGMGSELITAMINKIIVRRQDLSNYTTCVVY